MEVSVSLGRSDLIKFNWHMLPRARENRVMMLMIAVGVFVYLVLTKRPDTIGSLLITVFWKSIVMF